MTRGPSNLTSVCPFSQPCTVEAKRLASTCKAMHPQFSSINLSFLDVELCSQILRLHSRAWRSARNIGVMQDFLNAIIIRCLAYSWHVLIGSLQQAQRFKLRPETLGAAPPMYAATRLRRAGSKVAATIELRKRACTHFDGSRKLRGTLPIRPRLFGASSRRLSGATTGCEKPVEPE
jgi:hypothetical protein